MIDRKATDILLDIEKKVDSILARLNNQDLLIKNIANRMSTVNSVVPPSVEPETKTIPGIKPGVKLNIQQEKFPGLKNNNITVEQQLTWTGGAPIAMAKVEIFIQNGEELELVKTLKTNPVGKWMANISPGRFTIAIKKQSNNALKPLVEEQYEVVVPETSDGSIRLEDKVFKKNL